MMNSLLQYKKYGWLLVGLCCSFILRGQSPGGVSTNLTLWLKANAGTSSTTDGATVTTWNNQTGTGGNATTTSNTGTGWSAAAVAAPLYQSGSNSVGINFNPSLNFNGNKWLDGNGNFSTANTFVVSKFLATPSAVGPTLIGFDRSTGTGGLVESSFYSLNNTYGYQAGAANGNYVEADIAYTLWSIPTVFEGRHVSNTSMISTVNAGGTSTYVQAGFTRPNPYTGKYRLGNSSDNVAAIESGVIGEVISYNANLSATDRLKVQSYLALKYGISLGTTAASVNYTASDATVLWTGSATYQNNIAGIVRDDASALNQKQSKSVNTGLQVVMGNGNTIATDNASNSNTFSADKSALIWGDNAGSVAAWTTTGAPSVRQIVARTWKVQETGTVGSVKVQIADNSGSNGLPAEITTVYLLVDADGNFAAGATEVAMTLNGTNWEANVDFTTGQFFTFATQVPPAPGGVVTNGYLWFKADNKVYSDAGTTSATNGSTIQEWQNAFTNANVPKIQQTGATGLRPFLRGSNHADVLNFNPTVDQSSGTWMKSPLTNLTINQIAGSNTNLTTYAVYKEPQGGGAQFVIADHPTLSNQPFLSLDVQGLTVSDNCINNIFRINSSNVTSTPRMFSTIWGGGTASAVNKIYDRGVSATLTDNSPVASFSTLAQNYVGMGYACGTAYPSTTKINEIIVYSGNHSVATRNIIESYLAIKWGFTLGTTASTVNYTASDGTTVYWTGNATYQNNIAGIARDDASALSQKQSKSVNTGLQVVMGNGNTIATDNASNTNTFSADKSALIWGDNAGSVAAWTTTGAPPSRQIVARKWKVQETGTVGYVKVQVPDNGGTNGLPAETNTVYLLADADGNFASGATEVAMTLNGTNWEAPVDFTNGQFFTFATQENSPVNLNLAMTADKTTVSSGQNITYTLTLTNSGTNTATNVQVKDRLPAGVNFVSATPSSGTYNSTTGVWTLPSVAAGAQTLTIVVTAQ